MEAVTQVDAGLLVLRLLAGVTLSLHGFQKLFGWFGGGGLDATARWFASLGFGRGRTAALMAGGTEITGGLGVAAGLLTPLSAAGMIGVMTVAALVNDTEHGFWSVDKGWETNLYVMAAAATVAITGPGRLSLDAVVGLDESWGLGLGVAAIALGLGAGYLRWVLRRPPPGG